MRFRLGALNVTVRDEDWNDMTVLRLELQSVESVFSQRPSADYLCLEMNMEKLTVTGLAHKFKKRDSPGPAPIMVETRTAADKGQRLLNFSFENNPPDDPGGDLDSDKGSIYDQRIRFSSCPLQIVYDKSTVDRLEKIFRAPDLVNLSHLQSNAASKLREYREATTLSLQYVIDNHNLVDVDVRLESSNVILPHKGQLTASSALAVVNLGSIRIKSGALSVETKDNILRHREQGKKLRDLSLSDLKESIKENLRDQAYDKFSVSLDDMQVLVAMPHEDWSAHVGRKKSPMFLLKPTSLKITLQHCLIKNDPDMPLSKLSGSLESISINISDYRLIELAKILDSILERESEEGDPTVRQRRDSETSMSSALSSLANTGSYVQNTVSTAVLSNIVPDKAPGESGADRDNVVARAKLTQLKVDFGIEEVNLSLTQQEKSTNRDEELFHFTVTKLEAKATVRSLDFIGRFNIGGAICEHLTVRTPCGEKVQILTTQRKAVPGGEEEEKSLLNVTYTQCDKSNPDFKDVHDCVLKRIDVKLSSVLINVHQDAIMDLAGKVMKFIKELSSSAKNLMAATAEVAPPNYQRQISGDPDLDHVRRGSPAVQRQKSRITMRTSANLARWAFRAKKKSMESQQRETVEVRIVAELDSVEFQVMTSAIFFAIMRVRDLKATYEQTKTQKEITAKLVDFQVLDAANRLARDGEVRTFYEYIAESRDDKVFEARVTLFDLTPEAKFADLNAVDVRVEATMGRIKLVFVMKFVNDLLKFLEPFSGATEMVAERANAALEDATKAMKDAIDNSTRARLDIKMYAPIIIVPVHSTHSSTFVADLGTLTLRNEFIEDKGLVFDNMHFRMENLYLQRAKVNEEVTDNDIQACCPIIKPITFDLTVRRNMSGTKNKEDPAELKVTGTLKQVDLELSKEDYNVVMALLQSNFSEKGAFASQQDVTLSAGRSAKLDLPLKSTYSGSRSSISSRKSALMTMMSTSEGRHDEAKQVEFSFKFMGLKAKLYSGGTPLELAEEVRDERDALANLKVEVMCVDGSMLMSSAISASAYLENCVLEDCRDGCTPDDATRIVRLMEAKPDPTKPGKRTRMIDIYYDKDAGGNQNVEAYIYSFNLVGSVSYLLEIANFFVPETAIEVSWPSGGDGEPSPAREVFADVADDDGESALAKMSVFVKIDEPDIFLVENIDDVNSDALMLNTEVQFKMWMQGENMSLIASLGNIRCHTCRFAPSQREATLAQILKPCTLSFTVSRNEGHGTRVNCNMSDLCLNVSPHSIAVIQKSVQAFLDSMAIKEAMAQAEAERGSEAGGGDLSALWDAKPFKEDDFWFLRPDESLEAIDALNTLSSVQSQIADEQAIININNLVVCVESGVGNNTIPLILLESSFNCDVRNWSTSRMSAIGSMNLELAYYNSELAFWEPVIEPVSHVRPDGTVHKRSWDMNVSLQCNSGHDLGSAMVSPSFDDVDFCPESLPPKMQLALQSREVLEVTITKTFLGVIGALTESFREVTDVTKRDLPVAPFIVQNRTGKRVTLLLENKGFKYYEVGDTPGRIKELVVEHGEDKNLFLLKDRSQQSSAYVSPLQEQKEQAEASLRLKVDGERGPSRKEFELPVSKADKRFFPFAFRGDEMGDSHGIISEVSVDNGCKYVKMRSIVQIKNHYDQTINIFVYNESSGEYIKLCSLDPDETFDVPVEDVYRSPHTFHFQVPKQIFDRVQVRVISFVSFHFRLKVVVRTWGSRITIGRS